jgi:uncharacterized protein with PQ loop repeat
VAGSHHLFKYLQQKQNRTKVDALMSVAAVAHPLMAAPQIYKVFSTQQAAGLSIWTWAAWFGLGLIFMAYGIAHKLKPYIIMQLLWLTVDILMIVGIILYG